MVFQAVPMLALLIVPTIPTLALSTVKVGPPCHFINRYNKYICSETNDTQSCRMGWERPGNCNDAGYTVCCQLNNDKYYFKAGRKCSDGIVAPGSQPFKPCDAAHTGTNDQSQFNVSSQQEQLCLAKLEINEDDCRAYADSKNCGASRRCFWGPGYEVGKCWAKADGDAEACREYNAKSDCDAQGLCIWRKAGYEKGKCLTHTHGYESMCLKYYTEPACPSQSCYWGQQDEANICLARVDINENDCRAYTSSQDCGASRLCFWGPGYEVGKCWAKALGDEACRQYNAKSDCDAQGKCLWGQGYEKGKCLTHTGGHESMCLKYYTKSECPSQSCYWGSGNVSEVLV